MSPPFIYFCAQDRPSTYARGTPKVKCEFIPTARYAFAQAIHTAGQSHRVLRVSKHLDQIPEYPQTGVTSCCGLCVVGYACQVSGNQFDLPNFGSWP